MNLDNRKSRLLIEALTHSNWIENEWSTDALEQSLCAWRFLYNHDELKDFLILYTHKALMIDRDIEDKYKGQFRDCAVSIGNRTCPDVGKKALEGAVNMWIEKWDVNKVLNDKTLDVDKKNLKWHLNAHIEFEQIHPFVDGNGRIGRMLMNWQALKLGLDPVVIKVEDRFKYYEWFNEESGKDKLERIIIEQAIDHANKLDAG